MNNNGRTIRIIALIALILVLVAVVAQYAMSVESQAEALKDFKKDRRAHEKLHDSASEKRDCSECEYYEERQKDYDRNSISQIISAVTLLVFLGGICGILYATGVIIGKMSEAPAYAMQAAPAQPQEPFIKPAVVKCPRCGAHQQPGDRFCPVCGSSFEG